MSWPIDLRGIASKCTTSGERLGYEPRDLLPELHRLGVDQACVLEPDQQLRGRAGVTHAWQDTHDVGRQEVDVTIQFGLRRRQL